jgi:hypothetical protein
MSTFGVLLFRSFDEKFRLFQTFCIILFLYGESLNLHYRLMSCSQQICAKFKVNNPTESKQNLFKILQIQISLPRPTLENGKIN